MTRWLVAVSGWLALAGAIGMLTWFRSRVIVERYALGQAMEFESKSNARSADLREQWERLTQPARLRTRAERELGLQVPTAKQVLR